MSYDYTESNQFVSPCRYTYSSYNGYTFLNDYNNNRVRFLGNLSSKHILIKKSEEILDSILLSLNTHIEDQSHPAKKTAMVNTIVTDEILRHASKILVVEKCLCGSNLDIINKLLKKYEVSKKLYATYNSDYKSPLGDFIEPKRYCIFSLILLACYITTCNFQYLSTSLKVNDLLISAFDQLKVDDYLTTKLLSSCIISELSLINLLKSENGV